MEKELEAYRNEMEIELAEILDYWMRRTVDNEAGGFYGTINYADKLIADDPKGSVLNARILWSFSSAYRLTNKDEYLKNATRAFDYLNSFFIDKEFGGVYWTVDHLGAPLDTKKKVYAIAFCIYGFSEYYRATNNDDAKQMAMSLYRDVELHAHDSQYGGYFEAYSRDWSSIDDLRLSPKDANEKKSMNTHLHVLEAYANLYKIWPDQKLKYRIQQMLQIFDQHIIDHSTNHLYLFFNESWKVSPAAISFGHDIEAAWLLQEAAESIEDESLIKKTKEVALQLADAVVIAIDDDGGLWYEYESSPHHLIKEKHWWPQAESMVGYFNAWQINGDKKYFDHSKASWNFVKNKLKDTINGEWYWGIKDDDTLMKEDKAGLWKCPYHNSRACMELIQRVNAEIGLQKC
ncbi:MAG: AGE family epimerase/isomerase [Ginsengibacter sp.]